MLTLASPARLSDVQRWQAWVDTHKGFTSYINPCGYLVVYVPLARNGKYAGSDRIECRTFGQVRDALGY